MYRRTLFCTFIALLTGLLLTADLPYARADEPVVLELFRGKSCHCCSRWVAHVESQGFVVTTHVVDDLESIRARYGVPKDLAGCHIATVGPYFIEGHVPAQDIQKLLKEQPPIKGIVVIGMPDSFPGNAASGQAFDVLAITDDKGSIEIYTAYYRD